MHNGLKILPGLKPLHIVFTDDPKYLGFGNVRFYGPQCINGIRFSAALEFHVADAKMRMALNGRFDHIKPVVIAGQHVGFMRRAMGRHKDHLVQIKFIPCQLGHEQMPLVYGIKTTA